jgi:phosphoribosylaminoimidazole carboxylase (NCAIR synthetase)
MLKVGILGGGQLGRMLLQAAANYPVETHVLEADDNCPSAHLCRHFVKGASWILTPFTSLEKRLMRLPLKLKT